MLGVIYESRPNVTVDIAALAIKSGNACILRGGSETIHTNRALVGIIHDALAANGLPREAVSFVDDADRARILELLRLTDYVDLIIPRGGAALHDLCRKNSTIPVITGGMGINHIYVDETADQPMAVEILHNAKVSKPRCATPSAPSWCTATSPPSSCPRPPGAWANRAWRSSATSARTPS